jgi:hypothetical protein
MRYGHDRVALASPTGWKASDLVVYPATAFTSNIEDLLRGAILLLDVGEETMFTLLSHFSGRCGNLLAFLVTQKVAYNDQSWFDFLHVYVCLRRWPIALYHVVLDSLLLCFEKIGNLENIANFRTSVLVYVQYSYRLGARGNHPTVRNALGKKMSPRWPHPNPQHFT